MQKEEYDNYNTWLENNGKFYAEQGLNIPTYDEYYENPKQFNGGGRRKKLENRKR